MPKQIHKIEQFHGGLNSNSDPRDIADNELSAATDIMIDELGKIRTMGGTTAHVSGTPEDDQATGWTGTLVPGFGLFQFSHDRTGAEDAGSSEAETGDDYLAIYDDNDQQVWIYSKRADTWDDDAASANNAVIDIGETGGAKVNFYFADGALRVSDGNFGANNTNQWYGYIDRYQFGDGSTGVDTGDFNNGKIYDQWFSGDATLTALPLQSVGTTNNPDINSPVALYFAPGSVVETGLAYYQNLYSSGNTRLKDRFIICQIDFDSTDDSLTFSNNTDVNIENFVAEGDYISIAAAADAGNKNVFQVDSIDAGDPNKIFVTGSIHSNDTQNDQVFITNLSRCEWWDNEKQYLEFGMTTLYDDNQQESKINIFGTLFDIDAACFTAGTSDWGNPKIGARVFTSGDAGTTNTFGTTYPRVTGFNIYVRRASSVAGSGDFFRFIEISIKDGERVVEISDDFTMWLADLNSDDAVISTTGISEWGQDTSKGGTNPFPSLMTYTANANVPNSDTIVNVDAFKTAVVTNRMAYIGNVKQDSIVYGDRMMKSVVNQFDKFPDDRTIDVSINDGDEIIKLEEFADRILCFKKKKMYLINVSQELEILEDIFMYKGISHPAATCKTDFGIAWVNTLGCYLYDGQKVINLLEKQGRQIIKESEWFNFLTPAKDGAGTLLTPMIGYVPKKRQLIVFDDITTNSTADPRMYLYDIVTQSWTTGANDVNYRTIDIAKTNFSTDWNGDLIYAKAAGDVLIWDDVSDATDTFGFTTKDIDFGQPSQRKKVYKIYITYKTAASGSILSNVQVDYDVDGGITFPYDFTVPELPAANGWQVAELEPDTSSEANNIKSIRLRFATDNAVPVGFQINDISIVYRFKSIK